MICKLAIRLISGTQFVWFMICDFWKKGSQGVKVSHFFVVHAWHQKSQQSRQRHCAPELTLKSPSFGLVVFINMDIYKLTWDTNFKTFLKERHPIGSDSCYIFIKNMLNMDLKMMLIVLMEFAFINDVLSQMHPFTITLWQFILIFMLFELSTQSSG